MYVQLVYIYINVVCGASTHKINDLLGKAHRNPSWEQDTIFVITKVNC